LYSLLILVIGFSIISINSIPAHSKTITVPVDFDTIQKAIDNASPNDVIVVKSRSYSGFTVTKSLVIMGEGNQSTIVNGRIQVNADNVVIQSLQVVLTNPQSVFDTAITLYGMNISLLNIIVDSEAGGVKTGDMSHYNVSVYIGESTIISGRVVGNSPGIGGACDSISIVKSNITAVNGLAVSGCHYTQIEYSSISSYNGDGVRIGGLTGTGEVVNSTIIASGTAIAIGGSDSVVRYSFIQGSTGIVINSGSNAYIENNTIAGDTGISLIGEASLISGNIISASGHAIDLSGSGNIISYNVLGGGRGIHARSGDSNRIFFNFLNMTGWIGIYMSPYTQNNLIYGNTFWYCYNYNAADESGKNQWYLEEGDSRIGNYWYDHTGPDSDHDGIVDTPYLIATTLGTQVVDKYPLTQPLFLGKIQVSPTTSTMTSTSTTAPTTTTQETPSTSPATAPSSTTPQEEGGGIPVATIIVAGVIIAAAIPILLRVGRRQREVP